MQERKRVCLFLAICLLLFSAAPAFAQPAEPKAVAPLTVSPQLIPGDEWDYGTNDDDTPALAQNIQGLIPGNAQDPLWQEHSFDFVTPATADHDWYRFQVTQADIDSNATWLFEAHSETNTLDPVMEVYGPDDTTPTFANTSPLLLNTFPYWDQTLAKKGVDDFMRGENPSPRVSFTPALITGCTPGWYYIRVRPWAGGAGAYWSTPGGTYIFTAKRGGFERLGGANRFETAERISEERFLTPGWQNGVVLVNAWNYPDALAGASLAGVLNGPMLLSSRMEVPIPTIDELQRIKPFKTYALGGDYNIADAIMPSIEGYVAPGALYGLYGSGRVQTAVDVAEAVVANGGTLSKVAFVVNGWAWPDALAATPLASRSPYTPILLTHKEYADLDTLAAIDALGITDVVIVGSESVVSETAYWQIVDALGMDEDHVLRLGGADRYETMMKVALWSTDHLSPGTLGDGKIGTPGSPTIMDALPNDERFGVASGENFPDALGGGVLCGKAGMPILLTPKASLSKRILDPTGALTNYVQSVGKVELGFVFGSDAAVSYNVMNALDAQVSGQDWTP